MKLQITSASGNILSADEFARIIIMTEDGEITILPGHESLLSAVRPGILSVEYYVGHKIHTGEYATWWWVINVTPGICTIVADVIESGNVLSDMDYIASQKQEAEKMVKTYREENGTIIDPKKLIELEYELLKYTAMHKLGQKYHESNWSRK
jgi:F0F1-type ATP synthase epsilon subunit